MWRTWASVHGGDEPVSAKVACGSAAAKTCGGKSGRVETWGYREPISHSEGEIHLI